MNTAQDIGGAIGTLVGLLLFGLQATRRNIMVAIGEELPAAVEENDTVLLYFACHGSPERRTSRDPCLG